MNLRSDRIARLATAILVSTVAACTGCTVPTRYFVAAQDGAVARTEQTFGQLFDSGPEVVRLTNGVCYRYTRVGTWLKIDQALTLSGTGGQTRLGQIVVVGGGENAIVLVDVNGGYAVATVSNPSANGLIMGPAKIVAGKSDSFVDGALRAIVASGNDLWFQLYTGRLGCIAERGAREVELGDSQPDLAPLALRGGGAVAVMKAGAVVRFEPGAKGEKWRVAADPSVSSLAFDGGRIYAGFRAKEVRALDGETGATVWSRECGLDNLVMDVPRAPWVIVACDRGLFALDKKDGATRWERAPADRIVAATVAGDSVVVRLHSGEVRGFDVVSGAPKWTLDFLLDRADQIILTAATGEMRVL